MCRSKGAWSLNNIYRTKCHKIKPYHKVILDITPDSVQQISKQLSRCLHWYMGFKDNKTEKFRHLHYHKNIKAD